MTFDPSGPRLETNFLTSEVVIQVVAREQVPDELCVCGHLPESHLHEGCIPCGEDPDDDALDCSTYRPSGVPAAGYR